MRKNYMGCVYCIFDTVPEQVASHIRKHLNGGSNRHRDGCPSVDHRFSECPDLFGDVNGQFNDCIPNVR